MGLSENSIATGELALWHAVEPAFSRTYAPGPSSKPLSPKNQSTSSTPNTLEAADKFMGSTCDSILVESRVEYSDHLGFCSGSAPPPPPPLPPLSPRYTQNGSGIGRLKASDLARAKSDSALPLLRPLLYMWLAVSSVKSSPRPF